MNNMPTALTIAGSDPTGGAGLQGDLKTFKSLGVYGLSAVSVLTVQSTVGVTEINELPPEFFSAQLDCLLNDIYPDALKTGMIYSPDIVEITARKIKEYSLKNLVVDPVMFSSTGVPLAREGATTEKIKQSLFPLARVVTPNTHEATMLTGINIKDEKDMKKAAASLKEFGPETVIITGGYIEGKTLDILFDGKDFLSMQREKFDGEYHGTGCVFSSVITACLALGYDVEESVVKANEFVWNAIKSAVSIGKGMKILNI